MKEASYFEQVYEVVRLIPFGRVTSYKAIADYLALGSARMVGWAMNHSFSSEGVPAHRVVNHKGELTGRLHFPTPTLMQQLLENEGVVIVNDRIVDFEKHFWDPTEEI